MPEAIKMIYQGGSAEVIEKKSRFIGEIYPIGSEEEAQNIVNQIRKNIMMPDTIVSHMYSVKKMKWSAAAMTVSRRELRGGRC